MNDMIRNEIIREAIDRSMLENRSITISTASITLQHVEKVAELDFWEIDTIPIFKSNMLDYEWVSVIGKSSVVDRINHVWSLLVYDN